MLLRKLMVLVFVLACGLACGAPSALAQDTVWQKIEVTPFGGYKFGGKINVSGNSTNPGVNNLLIKSNYDYGVMADYAIWPNFDAEFMLVRQPSTLSSQDTSTIPPTVTPLTDTTLSTYTFGASYAFRGDAKLRPFIAGGLGWTHFSNIDNPNPNGVYLGFYNKLAYNIGGGAKYYFSKFAGFRVDFRYLATRTTPGVGTQCGYYGCYQVGTTNHANQGELNFGLILRF